MFQWGLRAAAQRVSFLPTRAGLGTDLLESNPRLKLVTSPYDDGEVYVAMPALKLDVALVHMNRADQGGNAQFLGPDPFYDDLFCLAADKRYVSCESIIATEDLLTEGTIHTLRLNRLMVDGVVEAPGGAHFTLCAPDYGRDEAFQREYVATAGDEDKWLEFKARYLDVSEADYQRAVKERDQ